MTYKARSERKKKKLCGFCLVFGITLSSKNQLPRHGHKDM